MINEQGNFVCDFCKGIQGEFNEETGNHTWCEKIAEQAETIRLLKEDGKRLANMDGYCCMPHEKYCLVLADNDTHEPDCPITLHNSLMAKIDKAVKNVGA